MATLVHKTKRRTDLVVKLAFLVLPISAGAALIGHKQRNFESLNEPYKTRHTERGVIPEKTENSTNRALQFISRTWSWLFYKKLEAPLEPEVRLFWYAGLNGPKYDIVLKHNLSAIESSEKEWKNKLRKMYKETALWSFLFRPLRLIRPNNCVPEFTYPNDTVYIPEADLATGLGLAQNNELVVMRQSSSGLCIFDGIGDAVARHWEESENLKLSNHKSFVMQTLKLHLNKLWAEGRTLGIEGYGPCITILISNDGIYATKGQMFELIMPREESSVSKISEITDCRHLYSLRLKNGSKPPMEFNMNNAIYLDIDSTILDRIWNYMKSFVDAIPS